MLLYFVNRDVHTQKQIGDASVVVFRHNFKVDMN